MFVDCQNYFQKDIEGTDCVVVEPIRNYAFNFTGLKKEFGFQVVSSDNPEKISFNVCGSLSKKCNNQSAAACLTNASGRERVFGECPASESSDNDSSFFVILGYKDKLLWNDGSIRFSYEGEKCNDKENYTMNVLLHCDYSGNVHDYIGAFHSSESCEATIVMRIKEACLPAPENLQNNKCIVNGTYDFTSLKNYNHVAGRNGTTFIIGVCNPVLYGHEAACPLGSSVCMFDSSESDLQKRYKNVGAMTEDFKVEKNHISLTLTSDEPCTDTKKYSSRIIFECDYLANTSSPTYQGTQDCVNVFGWPTALACPTKKSCKVTNEATGAIYDFSSLAGVQQKAVNKNNTEEKILFSVCGPAKEPCLGNTGSCVQKGSQTTSAGVANDELLLDRKNAYLLYEGGAACGNFTTKRKTRIDFICADNSRDEGAIVVEDSCDIAIQYKTLLACDYIKNCVATGSDDQKIDLSPLIDYEGNYVATVNQDKLPKEKSPVQYLLNVCRPLNTKYSLNCRGTAGACRTVVEKDGKHEKEMNLGHPDYSLSTKKVGDNDEVFMKYFHGDTCLEDKDENTTTLIRFYCDEKVGLGNPILQSIQHCEYAFDFATNILCREKNVNVKNESCSIVNDDTSVSVDLKFFGQNGVYKVNGKEVNICEASETKFYSIVYKQSLVRIEFSLPHLKGESRGRIKSP